MYIYIYIYITTGVGGEGRKQAKKGVLEGVGRGKGVGDRFTKSS